MRKPKEIIDILFHARYETEENVKNDCAIKSIVAAVLAISSIVLTILNIVSNNMLMMWSTIVLFLVFGSSTLIIGLFKKRKLPEIMMGITIMLIFSFYAISGQNDGFAILWIALVPALAMLLLSFRLGIITSIYFVIFLIVIFYTPLRDIIPAATAGADGGSVYSSTFMIRFPILYASGFFVSIILTAQKLYYLRKSEQNALFDALTGLKNRRYYNDVVEKLQDCKDRNLTIVSIDLNNLKHINDEYGHSMGDRAIISAASVLKEVFEKTTDNIFRTGGDEYMIVFLDTTYKIKDLLLEIEEKCKEVSIGSGELSMSFGYANLAEHMGKDINQLITIAETNMYLSKEEYYKRTHLDRRYNAKDILYK